MKIYSIPFCPFCFRVKLTVSEKNISDNSIHFFEVNLSDPPAALQKINPKNTVPTLEFEPNQGFSESLVIMEYLDEKFPSDYKIYGNNQEEKAQNKSLIEDISSGVTSYLMNCFFSLQSKVKFLQALEKLPLAFKNLESLLPANSKFFGGSRLNAVDLSFAPFFCYFYLAHSKNHALFLPDKETKSFQYFQNLINHPNIKKLMLENNDFIEHIKEYIADKVEIQKIKTASRTLIQDLKKETDELNARIKKKSKKPIYWSIKANEKGSFLATQILFKDYKEALATIELLCDLQETSNHHTSFSLENFQELKIEVCTHQPKWGVTEMDLAFAEIFSCKI